MEAQEAANLQMREAEGTMEVQEMVMSGEEAAQERDLKRAQSHQKGVSSINIPKNPRFK